MATDVNPYLLSALSTPTDDAIANQIKAGRAQADQPFNIGMAGGKGYGIGYALDKFLGNYLAATASQEQRAKAEYDKGVARAPGILNTVAPAADPVKDQAALDAISGTSTPKGTSIVNPRETINKDGKKIKLVDVIAPSGAKFTVNADNSERFNNLITDLHDVGIKAIPNQSGGYANRNIAGTNTTSKHASGNAIDLNWDLNPRGVNKYNEETKDLIRQIAAKHGATWGGDWRNPDPMHFEFNGSLPKPQAPPQQVAEAPPQPAPAPPQPAPAPSQVAAAPQPQPSESPPAAPVAPAGVAIGSPPEGMQVPTGDTGGPIPSGPSGIIGGPPQQPILAPNQAVVGGLQGELPHGFDRDTALRFLTNPNIGDKEKAEFIQRMQAQSGPEDIKTPTGVFRKVRGTDQFTFHPNPPVINSITPNSVPTATTVGPDGKITNPQVLAPGGNMSGAADAMKQAAVMGANAANAAKTTTAPVEQHISEVTNLVKSGETAQQNLSVLETTKDIANAENITAGVKGPYADQTMQWIKTINSITRTDIVGADGKIALNDAFEKLSQQIAQTGNSKTTEYQFNQFLKSQPNSFYHSDEGVKMLTHIAMEIEKQKAGLRQVASENWNTNMSALDAAKKKYLEAHPIRLMYKGMSLEEYNKSLEKKPKAPEVPTGGRPDGGVPFTDKNGKQWIKLPNGRLISP